MNFSSLLFNSYGLTECTFAVTSINISKDMICSENIPVGVSKRDLSIYM